LPEETLMYCPYARGPLSCGLRQRQRRRGNPLRHQVIHGMIPYRPLNNTIRLKVVVRQNVSTVVLEAHVVLHLCEDRIPGEPRRPWRRQVPIRKLEANG
jgi:hypothetical protein